MKFIVLITIILIPLCVSADVLFLDFNNNPNEVAAARRAATARKEKLVLYPDPTAQEKKNIQLAMSQSKELEKKAFSCADDSANCKKLRDDYWAASKRYSDLRPKISSASLEKKLGEMNAAGVKISSLVVSGHDGSGHFGGTQGSISDGELGETFSKFPDMKAAIRSLHLWGCYTTTPGSLDINWKKNFPNVALVSGFNGIAPLGDKPAGWSYLEGILTKEQEMIASGDAKKIKKMFDAIKGVNQTNSAICVGDLYVSPTQVEKLSELYKKCEAQVKELKEKTAIYQCYLNATSEKCKDTPEVTGSGPLREFYNLTQDSRHCSEIPQFEDEMSDLPSTDAIIRLIFTKNLRGNFDSHFKSELEQTDSILDSLGAPEAIRFSDIKNMSRASLVVKLGELKRFIDDKRSKLTTDVNAPMTLDEAKVESLRAFWNAANETIVNVSNCSPFGWVEPNAREANECFTSESMGDAVVQKALAKDYVSYGSDRSSRYSAQIAKQMTALTVPGKQDFEMEEKLRALDAERARYATEYGLISAQKNLKKAEDAYAIEKTENKKSAVDYYRETTDSAKQNKKSAEDTLRREQLLLKQTQGRITVQEQTELAQTTADLFRKQVEKNEAYISKSSESKETKSAREVLKYKKDLLQAMTDKANLMAKLPERTRRESPESLKAADQRVQDSAHKLANRLYSDRESEKRESQAAFLRRSTDDGYSAEEIAEMRVMVKEMQATSLEENKNRNQLIDEEAKRLTLGHESPLRSQSVYGDD